MDAPAVFVSTGGEEVVVRPMLRLLVLVSCVEVLVLVTVE